MVVKVVKVKVVLSGAMEKNLMNRGASWSLILPFWE